MSEPVAVSASSRVLYLIVCAAPPAQQTADVVPMLQAEGWDVCVIATPQASRWMDLSTLAALSGHVVRADYKLPGEADPLPKDVNLHPTTKGSELS